MASASQAAAALLEIDARHAQRWVRTVRRECLDRILIYNTRHLLTVLPLLRRITVRRDGPQRLR